MNKYVYRFLIIFFRTFAAAKVQKKFDISLTIRTNRLSIRTNLHFSPQIAVFDICKFVVPSTSFPINGVPFGQKNRANLAYVLFL